MPTTGGALAFADLVPPYEATLTKNLEAAGAIILAKTQLTELANWVASGMPGNYNGLNGYGMNPWDPRRDPRDAVLRRSSRAHDRRLELRRGHERQLLGGERRHGNVGLDPEPVESEHARRHQADGRAHQPLRRHSDHGRSGHARPDDAHRRRRRDHARRDGRRVARTRTIRRRASVRRRPVATIRDFSIPTDCKGARIGIPRAFFYERTSAGAAQRRAAG